MVFFHSKIALNYTMCNFVSIWFEVNRVNLSNRVRRIYNGPLEDSLKWEAIGIQ